MYKIATQEDVQKLLNYLEQDLKNCLYSYIDLKKFGIENPNLTIYFEETDEICCTALKYYEGLQLFDGAGKMNAEETAALSSLLTIAIKSFIIITEK